MQNPVPQIAIFSTSLCRLLRVALHFVTPRSMLFEKNKRSMLEKILQTVLEAGLFFLFWDYCAVNFPAENLIQISGEVCVLMN